MYESGRYEKSVFATFTYAEDKLPEHGSLEKSEFQKLIKRLRSDGAIFKYYACGEYGERFNRPHYHAIILGVGAEEKEWLEKNWQRGFVHAGTVKLESIQYVTGYMTKQLTGRYLKDRYLPREPPFQLVSQGFGKQYCLENQKQLETYLGLTLNGVQIGLPKIFRKWIGITPDSTLSSKMKERAQVKRIERRDSLLEGNEGAFGNVTVRTRRDLLEIEGLRQKDRNIKASVEARKAKKGEGQ